jgi:hypothetical protein
MRRLVVGLAALLCIATAAQAQVAPVAEGLKGYKLVYMEATAAITVKDATVTARYQILPVSDLKRGRRLTLFFPKRQGFPDLKNFAVSYALLPLKGGGDPPLKALPLSWPPQAKWAKVKATAGDLTDPALKKQYGKYYDRIVVFTIPAGDRKKRSMILVQVSYTQALKNRQLIMPFRIAARWPARIGKCGIRLKVPRGYWISSSTRSFRRARGGDYLWSFRNRAFRQDLGLRLVKGVRKKRRGFHFRWHINL